MPVVTAENDAGGYRTGIFRTVVPVGGAERFAEARSMD
jgi:hypothetical protein